MNRLQLLHRAREVYTEEGAFELTKRGVRRIKPSVFSNTYFGSRVDNEHRWNIIKPYAEQNDSFLDIGCAEGYFVNQVAQMGLFGLGIDYDRSSINHAREIHENQNGMGFVNWEISPHTVKKIPDVDIISLQTIFHHITREYGYEDGKAILRELASKCNVLVYEPPGDRWIGINDLCLVATNVKGKEEHVIKNIGKPVYDNGWSLNRPILDGKLPSGKYNVYVYSGSDNYKQSNKIVINVGKSGKIVRSNPRIFVDDGELSIQNNQSLAIEDMMDYYSNQLEEILGDITILETSTTDYKGDVRRDPFFIIDTSNI